MQAVNRKKVMSVAVDWSLAILMALVICWVPNSDAAGLFQVARRVEQAVRKAESSATTSVAAAGRLEVAFSPDEGAEALVVKVINSAEREILVMAYTFNSPTVTKAMLDAVHRGVRVHLVVDFKNNLQEDRSGKSRAALSALAEAGAEVRTIKVYAIAHDKVIVVDGQTVEMGSFNYSSAAAHRNSENVLVNWSNPALAAVYVSHFKRNYRQSEVFAANY